MILALEVQDCRDCPCRKSHRGHGECWEYCGHPHHNRPAYAEILWGCREEFKAVPAWCPLVGLKAMEDTP